MVASALQLWQGSLNFQVLQVFFAFNVVFDKTIFNFHGQKS